MRDLGLNGTVVQSVSEQYALTGLDSHDMGYATLVDPCQDGSKILGNVKDGEVPGRYSRYSD